jgi:hypothetical protein
MTAPRTLLGFDVTNVPTADLIELAATFLENDLRLLDKVRAMFTLLGKEPPRGDDGLTTTLVELLRERAAKVREMETQ